MTENSHATEFPLGHNTSLLLALKINIFPAVQNQWEFKEKKLYFTTASKQFNEQLQMTRFFS
jgi:hypothetical protein